MLYVWQNVFILTSTTEQKGIKAIKKAAEDFSKHTCIRLVEATSSHDNKLKFFKGDGCWSSVGAVNKEQEVSKGNVFNNILKYLFNIKKQKLEEWIIKILIYSIETITF